MNELVILIVVIFDVKVVRVFRVSRSSLMGRKRRSGGVGWTDLGALSSRACRGDLG